MMTVRVEMTYAEIARRLGVSTTSAKVLVRRALAKAGPRSPPGPTPTRSPGITAGSVASLDTTDAVAPSEPRCETVGDTHYSDGLNIWRKQMRCELGESHNENGSMHCVTTKHCVIHFR